MASNPVVFIKRSRYGVKFSGICPALPTFSHHCRIQQEAGSDLSAAANCLVYKPLFLFKEITTLLKIVRLGPAPTTAASLASPRRFCRRLNITVPCAPECCSKKSRNCCESKLKSALFAQIQEAKRGVEKGAGYNIQKVIGTE